MWAKSSYSPYPLQFIQTHIFFSPAECYNFFTGNLDLHKGSLVPPWVTAQVSALQVLWTTAERAGTASQATAGSTAGTEVCQSIT